MKNMPNIEKSAFHKGEYVGYSCGVWRITKSTSPYGNWWAVHEQCPNLTIYAWTLEQMSKRLAEAYADAMAMRERMQPVR